MAALTHAPVCGRVAEIAKMLILASSVFDGAGFSPASVDQSFRQQLAESVHLSMFELLREAHIKQTVDGSG